MKNSWTGKQYVESAIALVVTILFLFPIYWMITTSLKPSSELLVNPPHMVPYFPTIAPYVENFITNHIIFRYIGNSFIIAIGTTILSVVLATPTAYALARLSIKGKGVIMIVLLVTQMLPSIMLAIPFFILFSKMHLINTYLVLFISNTTHSLPFAVLVLRPYFLAVPVGLEEAAFIDGSNKFTTFMRVILPLVRPGLLTVAAFCFLWAWGDFIFALTLTSDESIRPLTLGLYRFITEMGIQWNNLMAVATVTAIPIIVIFITLQKYIVSGLASGAMKE